MTVAFEIRLDALYPKPSEESNGTAPLPMVSITTSGSSVIPPPPATRKTSAADSVTPSRTVTLLALALTLMVEGDVMLDATLAVSHPPMLRRLAPMAFKSAALSEKPEKPGVGWDA